LGDVPPLAPLSNSSLSPCHAGERKYSRSAEFCVSASVPSVSWRTATKARAREKGGPFGARQGGRDSLQAPSGHFAQDRIV